MAAGVPPPDAWFRPAAEHPGANAARAFAAPGADFLDRPIPALFADICARQPGAIALHSGNDTVNAAELRDRAHALAARLARAAARGEGVGILAHPGPDAPCAVLACLQAGCVALLLDPTHPPARIAAILDGAAVRVVLRSTTIAVPEDPARTTIDIGGRDPAGVIDAGFVPAPLGPDAPAIVTYTSGSTGVPKGIVRSQRQMLARVRQKIVQFQLGPADRIASLYPASAGPGLTACLMALLCGASFHPLEAGAGVFARIAAERITILTGIPALLRMLFALDGAAPALASLRGVYTTSEALLRSDAEAWRRVLPPDCTVLTGYGLTEGAPLASWFIPPVIPPGPERLPIGHLNPDMEFAIADSPAGRGELWVRSALLSLGEWQNGGCVPGRLLADPADPQTAILRTGDLVRPRADGLYDLLGRADAQTKIRGHRVEPAELAAVLRAGEGVLDAAAIAAGEGADRALVAFVIPAPDQDQAALRARLEARARENLPAALRPARIHLIGAIPRLPGGKTDTAALALIDAPAAPLLRRLARRVGLAG